MATLRSCLTRFFSHSEAELPEWAITAKRSSRSVDSLVAEVRSAGIRACPAPRQHSAPVPVLTPSVIDAENRRRLMAVGREVYQDKSFLDSITDSLRQRQQHRKTLADIKALGESILGVE